MKRYKFLTTKGKKIVSKNGNLSWEIGKWNKIEEDLDICNVGLHCSKGIYEAFSYVQGNVLAEVEVKGRSIKEEDKEVWSEMRIVRAWKWQKKDSLALAIYCAELVLKNFEDKYPDDLRPRQAIEAAKKVLFHDTKKNRSAAWSAVWSAESAWSARYAAWSAAWSAAESALIKKIEKWFINHLEELEEIK